MILTQIHEPDDAWPHELWVPQDSPLRRLAPRLEFMLWEESSIVTEVSMTLDAGGELGVVRLQVTQGRDGFLVTRDGEVTYRGGARL